MKKYALLSVFDKSGIIPLAQELVRSGYTLISTGGTFAHLQEHKVEVTSVSEYTGSPEVFGGRVKTLHPKVLGGILFRRELESDQTQAEQHQIFPIDVVVVNLYPFVETIQKKDVTLVEVIENIDIGGPTMVRAAAKNHHHTTILTDPSDYLKVIELLQLNTIHNEFKQQMAVKAFAHTASYDAQIDGYLSKTLVKKPSLRLHFEQGTTLRYGENSHQSAKFYKEPLSDAHEETVASAKQLHGKELSYNNLVDADAALELAKEFWDSPTVVIIKHTNPCGLATGTTLAQAFEMAWMGDPVSAFGSVITCSRKVDLKTAQLLKGRFVEILLAPGFEEDALEFLQNKSKDIRLLLIQGQVKIQPRKVYKHILGGMLVQDRDVVLAEKWECVTKTNFSQTRQENAKFAWKVCKHVKSNAIVASFEYEPNCFMLVGMGPGQPNRIDSNLKLCQPRIFDNAKRLAEKYNEKIEVMTQKVFAEVVVASDAFFPFDDNVKACQEQGIRYIVQPGGSKKDSEVIATADHFEIAMLFTGSRHFRH